MKLLYKIDIKPPISLNLNYSVECEDWHFSGNLQWDEPQWEWVLKQQVGMPYHFCPFLNSSYFFKFFPASLRYDWQIRNCMYLRWTTWYFDISIPHVMIITVKPINTSIALQSYHFGKLLNRSSLKYSFQFSVAILKMYIVYSVG